MWSFKSISLYGALTSHCHILHSIVLTLGIQLQKAPPLPGRRSMNHCCTVALLPVCCQWPACSTRQ